MKTLENADDVEALLRRNRRWFAGKDRVGKVLDVDLLAVLLAPPAAGVGPLGQLLRRHFASTAASVESGAVPLLPLPRTANCLVCGKDNPLGHRLRLAVDPHTGDVVVHWTPTEHHAGFKNLVHGGATATVLDEAMAWTAIWNRRRMCVCAEMTLRFRKPVMPGTPLIIRASVEHARERLVIIRAMACDESGDTLAEAAGKYLVGTADDQATMLRNLLDEPESSETLRALRAASHEEARHA